MGELARGAVADRPWGRTLAALGLRGVSGQLTLLSEGKHFLIAFEHGAIVAAASPLASDAAVRVALTSHLISSSQVPEISRRQASRPDRDEVSVIAELARLGPEHAQRLRRRVIAQRAARTFSINHGDFLVTDATELDVLPGCALDLRAIIYMGARANLAEQRLASELDQLGGWFRLKAGADDDLPQFGFTDVEQPVIERLRDGGTLAELEDFATTFVDSRIVRAVVYALASYNACDVAAPPRRHAPPTVPPALAATQPLPKLGPSAFPPPRAFTQPLPRVPTPPGSEPLAPVAREPLRSPPPIPDRARPRPPTGTQATEPMTTFRPDEGAALHGSAMQQTEPMATFAADEGAPLRSVRTRPAVIRGGSDPALRPPDGSSPGLRYPEERAERAEPAPPGATTERDISSLGYVVDDVAARAPAPRADASPALPASATPAAPSVPPPVGPGSGTILVRRAPAGRPPRQLAKSDTAQSHNVKALIAQRLKLLDGHADHFQLLGVPQDASPEAIRKAYFAVARQLHPDRLAALGISDDGKHAQRLFAEINAGFAILSDPARRAEYQSVLKRGGAAAIRAEQARAEQLARAIVDAEEAFHRGEMLLRRDQPGAAIADLERAVQLNPEEADYHAVLAWAQFCAAADRASVAPAVRGQLERAIQRSPAAVTARFYLGRVERMLGRDADAIRHFRDVLEAAPHHAEAASELRVLESRQADKSGGGLFGRKR